MEKWQRIYPDRENSEAERLANKYCEEIKEMLKGRKPVERIREKTEAEVKAEELKKKLNDNARENGYQPEPAWEEVSQDDLEALKEVPL